MSILQKVTMRLRRLREVNKPLRSQSQQRGARKQSDSNPRAPDHSSLLPLKEQVRGKSEGTGPQTRGRPRDAL